MGNCLVHRIMLKLNPYPKAIIMVNHYDFHSHNATLKTMAIFVWKRICDCRNKAIGCSKVTPYIATIRVVTDKVVLFTRAHRPKMFLSPQRLPQVSHQEQGKGDMQLGIGLIPAKPFPGMSGSSQNKHETQGYDCLLHAPILPRNLSLSRGIA